MTDACAKCGKTKNIFGPSLELTEYKNQKYCEECLKIVENEETDVLTPEKLLTDSERLTEISKKLDIIRDENTKQSNYLNTIKSIMVFFIVLFIIGIILQGCQAIFS